MKILAILAPVMSALIPFAAPAQVPTDPPPPPRSPEERICRSVPDLGTRLGRSRVCRSRQQWEDMRREQRATIDRAQRGLNPTVDGALTGN